MRSSSQKDLAVYDFNEEEEEAVEAASGKFKTRFQSGSNPKKEPLTKYTFLQALVTSGLNCKRTNGRDISCIDLHENDSPQGSFAVDSPERNLASTEEKSDLDEIMASSTSYDERGHLCLGEFDPETSARVDPLVTGASGLVLPSVGNKQVLELQSDGTPVDVISDDEESWTSASKSPSTSASDLAEDEDYLEHRVLDNCFTAFGEKDNDDAAVVVSPDYVIYGNTLYGEAQLIFFTDSIIVECWDASGNEEKLVLEWVIADIIHIECQWSGSVEAALVKFRLRATTVNGNERVHDNCDVVKLIFAVTDMNWLEKEQKIQSLAARYKDIWNVLHDDDLLSEEDILERNMFFPKHYFTEIPDSFEDVIYPKGDPDAVSISKRDIELLQPDTFINDTIIDFYIKYLKNKIQPNEKHRFQFFNSFFFRKLADLDKDPGSASEGREAFQRVRKWTRKVNIFEKDYIFIPVNFNLHWSLLVICHPGEVATLKEDDRKDSPKVPCILHMDSIKGSHSGLKNLVQSYLWEEWKERHPESPEDKSSKFSNLRFVPLELPQQENSFDCGLFLLHYVELFLEEAPVNFSPFNITKFSSFLSLDWFSPAEASFKRSLIRKLIYELLDDPSQKLTPTDCSIGHLSSGYCENDIEQEPAVEFLSEQCSPSKTVLGNSACSIAGVEINLLTASSLCVAQCDKQEGLVLREFLEPGAASMSSPEHRDHGFQENAPFQMPKCATCPTEEHLDTSERLVSPSLYKDDSQPVGGSLTTKICSISYCPKDVGEFEIPWNSMQEKEIGVDLLPKTLNGDHAVSNHRDEIEKPGSVPVEDCDYVPDSPTTSSGENQEGGAKDSQEIDTGKAEECGNCEKSQGIEDTTEEKSVGDEECQQINTTEAKGGDGEDRKETNTSEADGGNGGYCQEIDTVKAEAGDGEDCQGTDATEADGWNGEYCQEIDTGKAEAEDGEDCQVVDSTNEAEGGDGEDCQEIDTDTAAESGGSCQESLPPPSCQDMVITVDENSLDKDRVQLKRDEPGARLEQQYQKRQKVSIPGGGRRRTRSFARDCLS